MVSALAGPTLLAVSAEQRFDDAFATATAWAEILAPHDWSRLRDNDRKTYWRRRSKRIGVSATTTPGDPGGLWV